MDAPIRLPAEASGLYVSSREERGGQAISSGLKKNSGLWTPRRRSSLRMKPGLLFILVWAKRGKWLRVPTTSQHRQRLSLS